MHPALQNMLNEYQIFLKATEDKCTETQQKFRIIRQQIQATGVNQKAMNELFLLSHGLNQVAYLLMEAHSRVNNVRANYDESDQIIIDSYGAVAKKANAIVRSINTYKSSLVTPDSSVSI